MGYTIDFGDGNTADFEGDDPPSAEDIAFVEEQIYGKGTSVKQAQAPESPGVMGTMADIGRGVLGGIPKIGSAAMGGVDFALGGVAGALGATDTADAAFRRMEERNRSIDQFNQENLPVQTTPGKVARGATQAIGAVNPLTAVPTMAGMTGEQVQGLSDQGVDPETAGNVGKLQSVANVVLGRLGLGMQSGYLKEIVSNVGTGGVANWLSQKYLESKGYKDAAADFDPTDAENWMVDFLASVMGVRAQKGKKAPSAADPTIAKVIEERKAAEQAPKQVPPVEGETPLPPVDFSELPPMLPEEAPPQGGADVPAPPREFQDQVPLLPEEQAAVERFTKLIDQPIPQRPQDLPLDPTQGIDTEGLRNPYDAGGDVARLQEGLDTTLDSPQGDLLAPEGPPLRPEVFDEPKTMEGAVSDSFIRAAHMKGQGGAIDPAVFKEGFKRLNRALSNLTDRPWVAKKFPATDYMTNPDGTPMVMLHGTMFNIKGDLKTQDQGFHAGYAVPSHLIMLRGAEAAMRPNRRSRELRDPQEHQPKLHEQVHPIAIKRGNYPTLDYDAGVWSPDVLLDQQKKGIPYNGQMLSFKEYLHQYAEDNGYTLSLETIDHYRKVMGQAHGPKIRNRIFTNLLHMAGIDGFFYRNNAETLTRKLEYARDRKKISEIAKTALDEQEVLDALKQETLATETQSFVTWDDNNFQSIYKEAPKTEVKETSMEEWSRLAKASKQGGGIDVNEIAGGFGKLWDAAKGIVKSPATSESELATPHRQREAYAKIPGLDMGDMVSKDIPLSEIKAKILETGDIKNSLHSAIGSKEMIASIKNNPAIYWVGQLFTNARKRADLYHKTQLQSLEKDVLKLVGKKQAGRIADLMKQEMFAKVKLTDEDLTKVGLSENEMTVYKKLRHEFDVSLKALNDYRESTGQEPIKGHEAYLSSRWGGDWKTPVFNKDGKLVWYIAENSKAKAEHALQYLAKNHKDLDISKSKVRYAKDFFMTEDSLGVSTYKDMVDLLGRDDPLIQQLQASFEEKVRGEGESVLGHKKHMEPKAGIRGFLGDRPWVNDQQNTADLFKSQLTYLRNTHTWVELQKGIRDANKIITDKEVVEAAPNLVELLQDIKRNEMGYSTLRPLQAIERSSSKYLGHAADILGKAFPPLKKLPTDLQSINSGMGTAKAYFYITKLGLFNVPFAAMSIVQPIFTVPHHVQLSGEGYKHNPLKTHADAIGGGSAALLAFANPKAKSMLRGIQKEAFDYMEANGIGDLNQYSDANDIGISPGLHMAKKIAGLSMTESEKFARSVAFMGYVSHLKQSGKFSDNMKLFQKAEELTNKSMANYRHTERAGMFNKMGFLGSAASTLNTFKVNQYNQLYDFAKTAKRTGNYKPLLSMMGLQGLMAGALGMYGIDELEDLYGYFRQGLVEMGVQDKEFLEWTPKQAIYKNLPEIAQYGVFSKAMGDRNYSNRMSAGNIVDLSFAGVFPFVQDYAKQITAAAGAAKDYVTGSPAQASTERALHAIAPASLKPMVEMNARTMTDPEGNPYNKDQSALQYRRTPEDVAAKSVPFYGMQTIQESAAKDADYRYKQTKGVLDRVNTIQAEKFNQAVKEGDFDAASKALEGYAKLTGESKSLEKSIDKTILKRKFTPDEWKTIEGKSLKEILEIVRSREYKRVR